MAKRVLILSVALLAACQDKAAAPTNRSVDAAASDVNLVPGRYRQVTTLLDFNDPSMPPDALVQAKGQIGTSQTQEECLTPEMISNPREIIASSLKEGCTTSRLTWEKGKVDVAFACPVDSEFAGADASITGTYDADSYVMEMLMKDATGKLARLKVDARRTGDCT